VAIPGHGRGKLNSAFALGAAGGGGDAAGMRLLISTVQDLTGLTVDHFVRVSLLGFYDIANVLGPIQVCLAQPAHDPYSGTDLPAGVSTLDAKQALSFVRQRHGLPRGDLDREVRQQYFLSAELHKIVSAGTLLDPARTQALLGAVSSALETDPGLDLLSLAGQVQGRPADQPAGRRVPDGGAGQRPGVAGHRGALSGGAAGAGERGGRAPAGGRRCGSAPARRWSRWTSGPTASGWPPPPPRRRRRPPRRRAARGSSRRPRASTDPAGARPGAQRRRARQSSRATGTSDTTTITATIGSR
jgi:LCP family protein required for cell wall assembly